MNNKRDIWGSGLIGDCRGYALTILSGVGLSCIVGATAFFIRSWETDRVELEFQNTAEAYVQLLDGRLRNLKLELQAAKRFYENSVNITADEFSSYVQETLSASKEIISFSWIDYLPADGAAHAGVGSNGISLPISHALPTPDMAPLLGLDIAENSALARQLLRARDEGITIPVARGDGLRHMLNADTKSVVSIIQPVYSKPGPLETIQQRRRSIRGFLIMEYDVSKALNLSLERLAPQGLDIYIIDVEAERNEELVTFRPSRLATTEHAPMAYDEFWQRDRFLAKHSLNILGRQWKMIAIPTEAFLNSRKHYQSLTIVVFGALFTALAVTLLYRHQRRTHAIQETAETRRLNLIASEEKYGAVVENIAEGIILTNDEGTIETFNRAAEKIFGYQADEVIGRNVNMLMPEAERADHDHHVRRSDIEDSRIINQARTLFGQDKNGRCFPIELNVSVMNIDGRKTFIGIMHDVTESLANQRALRSAKEEAERANKAKSEFLSSMSHELRTPLNAILGFAQLLVLSKSHPLTEQQKDHANAIFTAGKHLLALIDEVLDLAAVEAGKIGLDVQPLAPSRLIEECLELAAVGRNPMNVRILPWNPGELPAIRADYLRSKQIVLNLLSNAIKYNRQEGTVWVETEVVPNYLRISVFDTGIGIPEERHAELFSPFNRLGAENTEIQGTGIGLALTKRMVEEMGGRIGYESNVGTGSVFWVELPLEEKGAMELVDRLEEPVVARLHHMSD